MMSTRRSTLPNFTAPLVLDPPRHCGLSSIALVPGRHLIGASAECGIRLQVEGVLDRHALILVGENRTVVKSMDPRTWVNDGPVTEMALRPGDRLSIGPLTFRVRSATREESAAFVARPQLEEEQSQDGERFAGQPSRGAPVSPLPTPVIPASAPVATTRPVTIDPPVAVFPTAPVLTATSEFKTVPAEASIVQIDAAAQGGQVVDATSASQSELPRPRSIKASETTPQPTQAPRVQPTGLPDSISSKSRDSALLDSRLDEIQQRLADLRQTTQSIRPAVGTPPDISAADLRLQSQQLQQRHEELQQRADEVAAQKQRLQEQAIEIAEREAQLESQQGRLAEEANRIVAIAESTRLSLAEEHAQHVAIWQEWEATYRRMTGDLTSQLDAIDRQRATLQEEAERLIGSRAELASVRTELEHQRQLLLADRAKLAAETAGAERLRAQLEVQRRQLQADGDERTAHLAADRRELDLRLTQLQTAQQELAAERQSLMSDWSTQMGRIEIENQRRTTYQTQLDEDRKRLLAERTEFAMLKNEFRQMQAELDRERLRLDTLQSAVQTDRQQLQAERVDLERLRDELLAKPQAHVQAAPVQPPSVETSLHDEDAHELLNVVAELRSTQSQPIPPQESIANLPEQEPSVIPPLPESLTWYDDSSAEMVTPPPLPPPLPTSADLNSVEDSDDPSGAFGLAVDWSTLASPGQGYLSTSSAAPPTASHDTDSYSPASYLDEIRSSAAGPVDPWSTFGTSGMVDSPPDRFPASSYSAASSDVDERARLYEADASGLATFSPGLQEFGLQHQPVWESQLQSPPDDSLTADETLAQVNRQFGVPVEETSAAASTQDLPAWWTAAPSSGEEQSTDEAAHPHWVAEALRSDEDPKVDSQVSPDVPETDLRSQLAMLFDLPTTTEVPPEDSLRRPERDSRTDETAADNRSTSETVRSLHRPATPAPMNARVEDIVPNHESSGVEDSVEEFMARLLARSRTGSDDVLPAAPAAPKKVPAPVAAEPVVEGGGSTVVDSDRSHLMAEPKHKQDKQAVRENLQSFRQVAHLSARSALARHSLRQLRNATIAKGVLLAASSIATITFLAEPLWGGAPQLWKGIGCALATLLSGLELRRSWIQLFKPIQLPAGAVRESEGEPIDEPKGAAQPAESTDPGSNLPEAPVE